MLIKGADVAVRFEPSRVTVARGRWSLAMANDTVTVLVVDDDDQIRQSLRWVLEDVGYPVLEAADGDAALDLIRHDPRRFVVLLDLLMPRLDGFGVLRAVAEERTLASRHAYILLSAQNRTLPLELSTLVFAVVPKPFDLTILLDAVESAGASLRRK